MQVNIKGSTEATHHWLVVRGIHRWLDSTHKRPVFRKVFPCHDFVRTNAICIFIAYTNFRNIILIRWILITVINHSIRNTNTYYLNHNDVIKWKHFPRYWPFMRGIHRSTVNFPHKGQWRGALLFSLICARINGWVSNREAVDLRRHRTHNDVIVMYWPDWAAWAHKRVPGKTERWQKWPGNLPGRTAILARSWRLR